MDKRLQRALRELIGRAEAVASAQVRGPLVACVEGWEGMQGAGGFSTLWGSRLAGARPWQ